MGRFGKLLLLLAGMALCAYAGETGKIAGRVVDAQTGEALVGVDVVVDGTDRGASTDERGYYLIINVPPGSRDVTASYMGYVPQRQTGLLVIPDQTATADFKLSSTVIQVRNPLVVKADRPLVVRTAVQTTRVVSAEDFRRLPVDQLTGLVGLQAGVSYDQRAGHTHIRGGRFDDVAYFVDGVVAQDAVYGTLWSSPRPTTEAVQEMVIITGGFDAEYGEAMSGIIQVTTKEGGARTSGFLKYTTDEVFPTLAYNFGYNLYQATIGGPIPFARRLRYFLSGELFYTDDDYNIRYKVPHADRKEYGLDGKISYSLPNIKFTLDGHTSRKEWNWFAESWRYWLDHMPGNRVRALKGNLSVNHQLSPNTYYTLKAGYFKDDFIRAPHDLYREARDTSGVWGFLRRTGIWERQLLKAEDFVFGTDSVYITQPYLGSAGGIAVDTIVMDPDSANIAWRAQNIYRLHVIEPAYGWTNNPYGYYGYVGIGDYGLFHYRGTEDLLLKWDITHNIKKVHEIKTGLDVKRYSLTLAENGLPWDPVPFWDGYDYHPTTGAWYIQDRADFEGLVVRAGLRVDYMDANAWKKVFPDSILRRDTVKVNMKLRLSPRFGMSFPITDRIKFRFSYGHFFQTPKFVYIYESLHADLIRRGNVIVGNPDLAAEKTIAYETGFDAQLSDVFAFTLTLFYKDVYDLVGVRVVPALPMSYSFQTNDEYARVQGFELTFVKNLAQYWSAKFNYTFQLAKGTAATAWENYGRTDPVQVDYFLSYDQRHSASVDLGLSFPHDFSFALLRGFDASMIARFATGLPYTPTNNRGERIGDAGSARMPSTFSADGRLSRTFRLGALNCQLIVDILNIFNNLTIRTVYASTGRPDRSGAIVTENDFPIVLMLGDLYYHPARDLNHDGYLTRNEQYVTYLAARKSLENNPGNYGAPRKIRVGVSVSF